MIRFGCVAVALALVAVPAEGAIDLLDASLRVDLTWAQGLHAQSGAGHRPHAIQLLVDPAIELGLPLGFVARGQVRVWFDAMDRLVPGARPARELWSATRPVLIGTHGQVEIRELTLAGDVAGFAIVVGKQQIVWGVADRLPLLDVVDPFDFREFVLLEQEDSRVPLWSVLARRRLGMIEAEVFWVPDPSVSVVPSRDALFAITSPLLVPSVRWPGVRVIAQPLRAPPATPSNWDYGLRLSTFLGGFDLATFFLRRVDDQPVYFVENAGRAASGETVLRVVPDYLQTRQYGLTVTRAFGALTMRGEVSYVEGGGHVVRLGGMPTPGSRRGFAISDELEAVLGLDWFGFSDTLLSLQVYPRWIVDHRQDFTREEFETDVTLRIRRSFYQNTLELGVEWIHSLDRGDGLVRSQVSYQWTDQVRVWLGGDFFYGGGDGIFGQFSDLDRLVVGMRINL